MTRRHDAVLFDLDDTLITWERPAFEWRELNQRLLTGVFDLLAVTGSPLPDRTALAESIGQLADAQWDRSNHDHSAPRLHDVIEQALVRHGVDLTELDIDTIVREYGRGWGALPGVDPFPDAHDVLAALADRGYRLGLVTNSMQPMWMREQELADHGLLDQFEIRIAAGDVGYIKPHRAIYDAALEPLGVRAERTVFVGDRPANDIEGANRLGMLSVLMKPPYLPERPSNGTVPDHVIASLSELLDLLD